VFNMVVKTSSTASFTWSRISSDLILMELVGRASLTLQATGQPMY
jgi:hypothetical protein